MPPAEVPIEWELGNVAPIDKDNVTPSRDSRSEFPGQSSDTHLVRYSDASRELGKQAFSGGGAWCVLRGVFYFCSVAIVDLKLRTN